MPGYFVVNSLAEMDIHIVARTYSSDQIAYLSKYVSEANRVPHPEHYFEQLIDLLVSNAILWEGTLILETADNGADCLSKSKDLLPRY
jgi:hypothetical protein